MIKLKYEKESKEYRQSKDLEKKQQILNEQKKNTFFSQYHN